MNPRSCPERESPEENRGPRSERTLLCLALHDEPTLKAALTVEPDRAGVPPLDPRTQALVRLGVCIALEAAPVTYAWGVDAALAAGATVEIVKLLAVAPVVGIGACRRRGAGARRSRARSATTSTPRSSDARAREWCHRPRAAEEHPATEPSTRPRRVAAPSRRGGS